MCTLYSIVTNGWVGIFIDYSLTLYIVIYHKVVYSEVCVWNIVKISSSFEL